MLPDKVNSGLESCCFCYFADKWKEGANNTTEGGGRKIGENKLLSKKNRCVFGFQNDFPPPLYVRYYELNMVF